MAVNEWQPGKVYVAGDLAKPRLKTTPGPQSLVDGDVEGLTVGSLLTPNWSVDGGTRFTGTNSLRFDGGSSTTAECFLPERVDCTPGETVGVSCMFNQGGSSANNAGGAVRIAWFDASDVLLAQNEGNIIKSSSGGWQQSSLSIVVPVGAVKFGVGVNGWHNGSTQPMWADHWVINYTPTAPVLNRLIYKAVQPDAGTSATDEPAWPSTVGVQVTDGTVTWEAVGTGFIVWKASPIMQSSGAEPDWPLKEGESVSDGTIIWEAKTTRVTDPKCPNSKVVVIMASKVFAVDKDIVRFSATANPLDWSTPRDAGFLPTGLQQANSNDMAVLGQFRGNLVAFNANCFQMWQVDPDPEQMALLDQMEGIGSTWKWAAQSVANDLYFLTPQGVRSTGIAIGAENLAAGDVGSPIDPLVQQAMIGMGSARATYYPGAGQYWLALGKVPAQMDEIVLWGNGYNTGLISIRAREDDADGSMDFNSEILEATSVVLTGWYSPVYQYSYPPDADSFEIDLSSFTFHAADEPFLNVGDGYVDWVIYDGVLPMPPGKYIVRVSVDGVTMYAAVNYRESN